MPGAEQATCSIVGVGASAGGLDALRRLFAALPADLPFAVVVIQHLDPSTRSQLPEIIARSSKMQVVRAKSGEVPVPGTVYVIPEAREARLDKGKLRLKQRSASCREPIDAFFASLAQNSESHGCGVLLSGNGADGALGLREIRGAGGITFVQDPATAEFPGMPSAAVDAGACDFIGTPEQLAFDLMAHVGKPSKVAKHSAAAKTAAQQDEHALAKILALVRLESGMDFSGYKATTVTRRVGRRALLKDADTLQEYLAVLEGDPVELSTLVDDMLINVTQFFRDSEVFDALRTRILPDALKTKSDGDTLRIWTIGASTGEEVYSLLITALEAIEEAGVGVKVTVFGTDASEAAIARARAGVYPPSICASVSPERLSKYFTRTEAGFEIDRALREMCVFARQDITKDTPFSRQDLVSLRNVLIYMDQPLQRRVLAVAHFALVPDGRLLLGTSETPESDTRLFRSLDKRNHVYQRQNVASRLPADVANAARSNVDPLAVVAPSFAFDADRHDARATANELALIIYAPPRVVIDANDHILHFFGDTAPFLTHAVGRATLNVAAMAHPGIALELKDALEAARGLGGPASREVDFVSAGTKRRVVIEVTPLPSPPGETQLMVAFREPAALQDELPGPVTNEDLSRLYESREQRVRGEMGALRGRLRAVGEERETANQELRSANEEIRSSNEELQSINEELETAKEELQSANEELITVNDELRQSNRDFAAANDDLTNFNASIDVPILMLDRSLRVRRFTASASRVVCIEDSDAGRLLEHLRLRVRVSDLPVIITQVIETGVAQRREVQDEDDCWFAMTVRPYRPAQGEISGAVVAFEDIDALKRNAEKVEHRANLNEALAAIDADLASTMEFDEIMQRALDAGARAVGTDAGSIELRDEGCWVVRYLHGLGALDTGLRLSEADAPLATAAARLGAPITVADVPGDSQVNVGFAEAHSFKSGMAIPLSVRGAVVGALLFWAQHAAREFTPEEIDFGRRLGTSVSLALENARLMDAERESTRRAETLNAINEIISTALTPDELLRRLVTEVSAVAGAEKALVVEKLNDEEVVLRHVRNIGIGLVGKTISRDFFTGFGLVAMEGKPVLIGDVWADGRLRPEFVIPNELRATQLLPLVVDGEVVAVVAFAYGEPRAFDADDEAFAVRASHAMSIALKNARLYESEQHARQAAASELEATSLLLDVAEALAGSEDLAVRLEALARLVSSALVHDRVVVSLWDEAKRRLSVVATYGGLAPAKKVFDWDELSKRGREAIDAKRTQLIDYGAESAAVRAISIRAGFRLAAAVPLVLGERVVGLILADQPAESVQFTDREIELLESIGSQAAVAIENDRLFTAEAERAHRMDALRQIAEIASASLDPRDVATSVVESLIDLLDARQAQIRLVSADGSVLEAVASGGLPDGYLASLPDFAVDSDVETARCFATGEVIVGEDLATVNVSRGSRKHAKEAGVRSCILVPLRVAGETIGTVYVAWGEPMHFDAERIGFVEALAAQFAVGLQNARLFEAEQTSRARVEALHELTELATSSLDLNESADRALEFVHAKLGVDVVTFWTFNADRTRLRPLTGVGFPREFYDDFADGVGIDAPFEIARAVKSGTPVVRPGGHIGEVPEPVRKSYAKYEIDLQALLVLPVRGPAGMIGAVTFAWAAPRELPPREVTFFASVANELAVATENATLYAAEIEARRQARIELETATLLLDTANTLATGANVIDALGRLADTVEASSEHKRVTLSLWDEERRELRVVASRGVEAMPLTSFPYDSLSLQIKGVLESKATFVFDYDALIDGELVRRAEDRHIHLGLIIPIVYQDRVLGLIVVDSPGERHEFGAREIERLEAVAAQAAVAVETARLFDSLQASERRVTSILESIGDGFYALDRDWCFTYANAEAGRMIGTPHTELLGKTMGEVLGDEKVFEFQKKAFAPAMSGERVVEFERYFPQTGIWAEVRAFPSADGIAVYGHDVTERKVAEEALRETRARAELMANLLDESSQPFGVGNLDGSMGLVNRAYESLTGYSAEELAQVSWATTLTPPEYREMEQAKLVELEATGEPVRYEKEYQRKDGSRVPIELLVHLDTDETGSTRHYYAFVTDLTERKEFERLDEAFNEIRSAVGSTLEYGEILRLALASGAQALGADSASVLTQGPHGWHAAESLGGPESAGESYGVELVVAPVIASQGLAAMINDPAADGRLDPAAVRKARVKAIVAAPLGIKRAELGVLAFSHRKKGRTFTEAQLGFVTRLARVVALAIQNSMLYERERRIADTLQEALLAAPEPIDGIATSYVYRAASDTANVGGDFFEVFTVEDGRCLIVVGDVSGKGLEAARLTSLLHDGIRAYSLETSDPVEILSRLNRLVCHLSPPEQFATLFLGLLDVGSGKLRFCTAGHPPPFVVCDDGASYLLSTRSPVLGAFPHAPFHVLETVIAAGERLVLFTDGVTEARRGTQLLGEDRLLKMAGKLTRTPTRRLPERLLKMVLEYANGHLRDDTVILCVERIAPPSDSGGAK